MLILLITIVAFADSMLVIARANEAGDGDEPEDKRVKTPWDTYKNGDDRFASNFFNAITYVYRMI